MPIQSSFPTVADQVISSNKNIIEILGQINSLATTTDQSVNIRIYDENGVLRTYAVPSFASLKGEIDRLNNNINSLYSIDAGGAMIATSNQNKYKKIITVDLNKEPNAVGTLGTLTKFKALNNWFFDGLMSPIISIELDLTGKVEAVPAKVASTQPAVPPTPFDVGKFVGIFAAIGLALGAIGSVLAAVISGFLDLAWWKIPFAILGLLLLISGPSMIIAFLKLRKRNLAPILDANGWAINARVVVNIPFGNTLTHLASIPFGAKLNLNDPFAERGRPWWQWALVVVAAVGLVLAAMWKYGWL